MSGYSQYGNEWGDPQHQPPQNAYSFDLSGADFGSHPQELSFQSFDQQQQDTYAQAGHERPPQYTSNPYLDPSAPSAPYTGEIFTPSMAPGPQARSNFLVQNANL